VEQAFTGDSFIFRRQIARNRPSYARKDAKFERSMPRALENTRFTLIAPRSRRELADSHLKARMRGWKRLTGFRERSIQIIRLSREENKREKEAKSVRLEKTFINSTYRTSLMSTHVYLYSYSYMKLLRRLKPIIGEGQTYMASSSSSYSTPRTLYSFRERQKKFYEAPLGSLIQERFTLALNKSSRDRCANRYPFIAGNRPISRVIIDYRQEGKRERKREKDKFAYTNLPI